LVLTFVSILRVYILHFTLWSTSCDVTDQVLLNTALANKNKKQEETL